MLEEQHMELRREKEENLRRFQERVRRRVAQQAKVRKRQQLQKTCEMVSRIHNLDHADRSSPWLRCDSAVQIAKQNLRAGRA